MKILKKCLVFLMVLMTLSSMMGPVSAGDYADFPSEESFRAIAQRNQIYNPQDSQILPVQGFQGPEKKEATVLIYMVGSNLESLFGQATRDLEEMRQAGLDYSETNLLVYTGAAAAGPAGYPVGKIASWTFLLGRRTR